MKAFAVILTIAFITVLVSCGPNSENTATSLYNTDSIVTVDGTNEFTNEDISGKEIYKIDVFTMLGNYSGIQKGWFGKIVRDKFNIEMNIISSNVEGGESKFSLMKASGDLGDIVIFGNTDEKYLDSISGGYLLDMTRNGLLDKYGSYIVKNYPKVLQKAKVNFGNGIAVYGLGYNAANMPSGPSEGEDMVWGPNLRWDLYAKLGYPKIKTLEDYLPLLKQMQRLEPVSETGWPTYGFSLWSDWDGDKMCLAKQYCNVYGYDETDGFNPYGYALISADGTKYQGILEPDGFYVRCLRLYFNANQMGLLDPDSISQKYEDVANKMKDGQILFSWFPWMDDIYNTQERLEQGKGFMLVPFEEEVMYSVGFNPYGGDRIISIGANAEYPERIMEFINWMYTPEGFQVLKTGPKGLTWDIDENGKPYLTPYGIKALPGNPEPVPEEYGGGTFKDGVSQLNIDPIHPSSINPETGEPYDYRLWSFYKELTPPVLIADWRKKMGALNPREYFMKNNKIAVLEPIFTGKAPEAMSKTLEQKKGQVSSVIKQYSWRMVYARDQEEFEALYNEMVAKATSLGYEEILNWNIEQAKKVAEWRRKNREAS